MILTNSEIIDINQNADFDSAVGYARKIESAVLEKLKAQEPALVRYNKHMNGEVEPDPVERLRFFLSLSLTGQNWLDVEKFLDDLPPDDVVRDAERYRWLRSENWFATGIVHEAPYGRTAHDSWEHLDAAIDKAMKEMK